MSLGEGASLKKPKKPHHALFEYRTMTWLAYTHYIGDAVYTASNQSMFLQAAHARILYFSESRRLLCIPLYFTFITYFSYTTLLGPPGRAQVFPYLSPGPIDLLVV
jgi:hypothetical protein